MFTMEPLTMTPLQSWRRVYRKSHFAPAFFFLSKERRQALQTLYAVCRVLDDAVDTQQKSAPAFLDDWKTVFLDKRPTPVEKYGQGLLAEDFLKSVKKFDIPIFSMVDLIEKGVAVDLKPARFQTPLDTEAYCYGVAGTVGLACLPIFGVPVEEAKEYAIRLGITVQWINTLRDVGTDARMGRIYLPLDHLEQFGYTEEDLLQAKSSDAFYALMSHEVQVARGHFKRAQELCPEKWKKQLLPARIMGRVYETLLEKIEKEKFPVYRHKIKLGFFEKCRATIKEIRG